MMGGPNVAAFKPARRKNIFRLVAVNCIVAGGTCFCVSMGTGPRASRGFDLALTELVSGEQHDFPVEIGSQLGAEMMAAVPPAGGRRTSPALAWKRSS